MPMSSFSREKTLAWLTSTSPPPPVGMRAGHGLVAGSRSAAGEHSTRRAFLRASDVVVGPRIRSNSCSVDVWMCFDIAAATTTAPGDRCGEIRHSWSSRSAELFGIFMSTRSTGGASGASSPNGPIKVTAAGSNPFRRRFSSVPTWSR